NNRPIGNRRALGNYDDAFADVVIVAVEVWASGLVEDADVRPHPYVFINDGFANDGVFADAYPGQSALSVIGQFGQRLVIIGAHHERVFEARPALDPRADADNGVDDRGAIEDAAVGDQRIPDFAIGELGAGQITRVGVDRRVGVEEVEFRHHRGEVEIGVVKRTYSPDVFPVTVEQISLHIVCANGRWKRLAAEILVLLVFEQFAQRVVSEKIYAHRSDEGPAFSVVLAQTEFRCIHAHHVQLVAGRFFAELGDPPVAVGFEQAETGRAFVFGRDHRDRHVPVRL